MTVTINPTGMTMDEVVAVARENERIELSPLTLEGMARSRARIDELAGAETPVYGISTGFGALANRHIAPADREVADSFTRRWYWCFG